MLRLTWQVQAGACRDRSGGYGRSPRIEGPGKAAPRLLRLRRLLNFLRVIDRAVRTGLHFSDLVAKCVALGPRCDALDINGHPPKPGSDPPMGCTSSGSLSISPRKSNQQLPYRGGDLGPEYHRRGREQRDGWPVAFLLRRQLRDWGGRRREDMQGGPARRAGERVLQSAAVLNAAPNAK